MKKLYEIVGGRKLLFAIVLLIISSILLGYGKLDSAQWVTFQIWIFGTYASGNVGEHIANAIKK